MIDYINSDLYNQDGTYKQIEIVYDDGTITNSDLHYEKFELDESLCSEMQLKFGSCEASKLVFRLVNPYTSMKGKSISVYNILNKDTENPFQIGKYKVYSDVPSADRKYRDITAYDAMYDIINSDVTEWYESMFSEEDTQITLKTFRNAFISHFGLEEEEIDLVNDSMLITKTISGTGITGKTIISAICEINGCFGHIGRDGKFKYIYLVEKSEELFPANDLYPSDSLFPLGTNAIEFSRRRYKGSPTYEDYKVQKISKLQIRMEEDDIGVVVGDGDNQYVIQDNFLVYGLSTEELTPIAENILNAIKVVEYRPCSVSTIGNPCLEVGDLIRINTKTINIDSYVLKRVLSGIQVLTDSYTADGDEYYSENLNTPTAELQKLKGKTNVLTRTLEKTISLISDVEKGLQTQITQNAQEISLKAAKKDINGSYIIGQINVAPDTVSIAAGHISLEGLVTANKNFKVLTDGSIEAVNGKFTGTVNATKLTAIESGQIACWGINNDCIYKTKATYGDPSGMYFGTSGISISDKFLVDKNGYLSLKNETELAKFTVETSAGGFRVKSTTGTITSTIIDEVQWGGSDYMALYSDYIQCKQIGQGAQSHLNFESGYFFLDGYEDITGELTVGGTTTLNGTVDAKAAFNAHSNITLYHGMNLYGLTDSGTKKRMAVLNTDNSDAVNAIIFGNPDLRTYLSGASIYIKADDASSVHWYSDKKLKKNIVELDKRYLVMFDHLQQVLYNWKASGHKKNVGYIANQVEEAMEIAGISLEETTILEKVADAIHPENGRILTLDYEALDTIAEYAIKDARKRLAFLENIVKRIITVVGLEVLYEETN